MKKIISIMIVFALSISYMYGCLASDTPVAIGKKIDKTLTNLYEAVSNLDTIDNSYIANPDIYQLDNINNTLNINTLTFLPDKMELKKVELNSEDKIIKKTIADNNDVYKLTIENDNDQKESILEEDIIDNNIESNQNLIENNNSDNNEEINNDDQINNDESKINETIINESIVDSNKIDSVIANEKDEISNDDEVLISENTNTNTNTNNDEDLSISEEDTTLNNSSENAENTTTNVEIVFEENLDDSNQEKLKDVLILDENGDATLIDENGEETNIEEINNEKIEEILEETITNEELTNEEKNTVYYFLFDKIRYTPRYALDYNTETAQNSLNTYVYKIQELYTMTADVIEANDVLLNQKEILLNQINTLKQINNKMVSGEIVPNSQQIIALDNYNQDIKTTLKRIKDCNGQLNNEVNSISTSNSTYGLAKGVDIINSNYLKILNHIDVRITYFKNALATIEQLNYILSEAEENVSSSSESIKTTNENTRISNIDTYKQNAATNPIKNTNNYTAINNTDNINNSNKEIDTYDSTNPVIDDNIDNAETNKNSTLDTYNNGVTDNNIIDNNNNNNDSVTNINNGTNTPPVNMGANNGVNNGLNNGNGITPFGYRDNINAPTGTYQNGIITQNNLNNGVNNGVYGNTTGYATGAGEVDYYKINNFQNTNKNVNTYGRNTMVDMINNGTVNNGINTLFINDFIKPILVEQKINEMDSTNTIKENSLFQTPNPGGRLEPVLNELDPQDPDNNNKNYRNNERKDYKRIFLDKNIRNNNKIESL